MNASACLASRSKFRVSLSTRPRTLNTDNVIDLPDGEARFQRAGGTIPIDYSFLRTGVSSLELLAIHTGIAFGSKSLHLEQLD